MRLLYVGDLNSVSTSFHRAEALRRIGCEVTGFDPREELRDRFLHPLWSRLDYRTGFRFIQKRLHVVLRRFLENHEHWPLVWVDSGKFLGPQNLDLLRKFADKIVLYNLDDPTGPRDPKVWTSLLKSIPAYDLCVTVRRETERELGSLGAKRVLRVWRSYDEVAHQPLFQGESASSEMMSDVIFVGTWMPGRDRFLNALKDRGIRIAVHGNRWRKAPKWSQIQGCWRGGAVVGREQVKAISGAKVALGLLSAENRDLHTQRSLEIPYMGGLLCAERTVEHLELYRENEEAVFWNNEEECARICAELLGDPERRDQIRQAGMKRVRELKVGNTDVVREVLSTLDLGVEAQKASCQNY